MPTVPVSTHVFARLAKATSLAGGVPTMRNAFVFVEYAVYTLWLPLVLAAALGALAIALHDGWRAPVSAA